MLENNTYFLEKLLGNILLLRKNAGKTFTESCKSPVMASLWIAFNCLKADEPLRGDTLLLTIKSLGVDGTLFIDLGRMKGHSAVLNKRLLDYESNTLAAGAFAPN